MSGVKDTLKQIEEAEKVKATGEDSVAAGVTDPEGGSDTKRKADKEVKKGGKADTVADTGPSKGPNNVGMKEGIEAIFSGADLSEDVKVKAEAIFEATVNDRVSAIKEELEEKFEADLTEQATIMLDEMSKKLDGYLDMVVERWISENEIAIESSLKVEQADAIFAGLKALAEEYNIDISEESVEATAELENRLEEQKSKNNILSDELVEARELIKTLKMDAVFDEVSEGLADTDVDRFKKLVEGITFDDLEDYEDRLVSIKESYFTTEITESTDDVNDELVEEVSEDDNIETMDEDVSFIMKAISNKNRK